MFHFIITLCSIIYGKCMHDNFSFYFFLVFFRYVMCTEGMQIPNFIIVILFGKSYAFFRKNNIQIKYVCYCLKTRNLPLFKASIFNFMCVCYFRNFHFAQKFFGLKMVIFTSNFPSRKC